MRRNVAALGVMLNAAALACVGVAFARRNDAEIEGAYLNESAEADATFVVSAADIEAWLVAAAVLIVLGTAALVAALRRAR